MAQNIVVSSPTIITSLISIFTNKFFPMYICNEMYNNIDNNVQR